LQKCNFDGWLKVYVPYGKSKSCVRLRKIAAKLIVN